MGTNKNCGVYIIISPTNKRYIGSSKSLSKRFNRYKNYSCSKQSAILSSLKKYGAENHTFRVLFYCDEHDRLFWERVFGDIYRSLANFEFGLNITLPGYGDVPQVRSDEFKKRVSEAQKNRFKNESERKKISEKTKLALSNEDVKQRCKASQKNRYKNEHERIKRSEARKNYYEKNPQAREDARRKSKDAYKNNPLLVEKSKETFLNYYKNNPGAVSLNLSKRKKNKNAGEKIKEFYLKNPEARLSASEKSKKQFENRSNNVRSKKVIDTDTGNIFDSAKSLSEHLEKPYQTVLNWIKGVSKIHVNYKYLNE